MCKEPITGCLCCADWEQYGYDKAFKEAERHRTAVIELTHKLSAARAALRELVDDIEHAMVSMDPAGWLELASVKQAKSILGEG